MSTKVKNSTSVQHDAKLPVRCSASHKFKKMKVTIIERQDFEGKQLKQSIERVCYPKDMKELSHVPIGFRAKRIRLECEFDENDIPKLLAFLQNSQPCFGA